MGCNKIALAHHADDVAVTTLLNLVYGGRCETMPARRSMFGGTLTLIRPLYLVEERRIAALVSRGILSFTPTTCAEGRDSRRAQMADILAQLQRANPRVKRALLHAVGSPDIGRTGEKSGEPMSATLGHREKPATARSPSKA